MNDLEKDLNDSRAKVPTVTEDTKKEPSSPPSSAPEKVSVEVRVAFLPMYIYRHSYHLLYPYIYISVSTHISVSEFCQAEKGLFTQNGWLRAPLASAHIGSRVRVIRALARYVCDGQVDAYLPPHVNEGIALWQVKHDNGDR